MLYANALDRLLKAKQEEIRKEKSLSYMPNLSDTIIKEIASNGTGIIVEIIKQKKYSSITGYQIHIDQNGDSEGNFSVLVLKKYDFSPKDSNMSCDFHMRPIATFQGSLYGDSLPVRHFTNFFITFLIYISSHRNINLIVLHVLNGQVVSCLKTSPNVASKMSCVTKTMDT